MNLFQWITYQRMKWSYSKVPERERPLIRFVKRTPEDYKELCKGRKNEYHK